MTKTYKPRNRNVRKPAIIDHVSLRNSKTGVKTTLVSARYRRKTRFILAVTHPKRKWPALGKLKQNIREEMHLKPETMDQLQKTLDTFLKRAYEKRAGN